MIVSQAPNSNVAYTIKVFTFLPHGFQCLPPTQLLISSPIVLVLRTSMRIPLGLSRKTQNLGWKKTLTIYKGEYLKIGGHCSTTNLFFTVE